MRTIALIGPDGAGKSSIAHELVRCLDIRARYLYMGVNLESSGLMLPTTYLALALKRAQGRGADMTASWSGRAGRGGGGLARRLYAGLRLLAWIAEEWYRAAVAALYVRLGYLVVFDRHFLYDYWCADVVGQPGRPLMARLHGELLRRFYPRPDLAVCLDAPATVLHDRKREQSLEVLDRLRRQYLSLASVGPEFVVVDVARPMPVVVSELRQLIEARVRP